MRRIMGMLSKINDWCRRELTGAPAKPASKRVSREHECVTVEWAFSDLCKERGASPFPMIFTGHSLSLGKSVAERSTLNALLVDDPAKLSHVCTCPAFIAAGIEFVGIVAMSRPEHTGEAQQAIENFRSANRRRGAAVYAAWDYNVERAARHAISCRADGILMPGVDSNEMLAYLFGVLERVRNGASPPLSLEEHVALLRQFTSNKSSFWSNQNLVESPWH